MNRTRIKELFRAHLRLHWPLMTRTQTAGIASLVPYLLTAAALIPPAQAQVDEAARSLDPETLAETDELEPGALGHAADYLATLAEDPVDLNTAGTVDLARLPGLTALTARRIVAHRRRNGPFTEIEQLLQIDGIDPEALAVLRPFVRPRPSQRGSPGQRLSVQFIQRAGRRLDVGRGYDADTLRTTYLGDPWRIYTRLTLRYGRHLQANLTLEKDPGEVFLWRPDAGSYGFDFTSGSLSLRDVGPIRMLVAGDFSLDYGLGLALSRGAPIRGGGASFRGRARIGSGIVPYTSSDENRFLRGVAAAVAMTPAFTVAAFASRRRLDASRVQLEDGQYVPRAPVHTGYHRTTNEQGQKGAIGHTVYGGSVAYTGEGVLQFGVAVFLSRFSESFHPAGEPYRYHTFTGAGAAGATAFATVLLGPGLVFAETSATAGRALAARAGVLIRTGRSEALLEIRHAPPRYASWHGLALGSTGGNDRGLVAAIKIEPASGLTMFATLDQSRTSWVRYAVPRPSTDHNSVTGITYEPKRWLRLRAEVRSRTRDAGLKKTDEAGRLLDAVAPADTRIIRLEGDYTFSKALRLRVRGDRTRAAGPHGPTGPESAAGSATGPGITTDVHSRTGAQGAAGGARSRATGTLLSHDLYWTPSARLRLGTRLAFFDIDDYTARIFTYEDDLVYTFSVPSFSGRGQRAYVVVRIFPRENLSLEFKYAVTLFEDVFSVGSGLDETPGRLLREARAQIRWKFLSGRLSDGDVQRR